MKKQVKLLKYCRILVQYKIALYHNYNRCINYLVCCIFLNFDYLLTFTTEMFKSANCKIISNDSLHLKRLDNKFL